MSYKTVLTPSEIATKIGGPFNNPLDAFQATIAAGIVGSRAIDRPSVARDVFGCALVGGTVTNTVVMPKKVKKSDGTTVSMLNTGLTLLQSDTDPVRAQSLDWVSDAVRQLEPGDVVYLEVTGAPTGGTSLMLTMNIDLRFDDAVEKTEPGMGGSTP